MGNAIPALIWVPFFAFGLYKFGTTGQVFGIGLVVMLVGSVLGWVAINLFGFFDNHKMRSELERKLTAGGANLPSEKYFVGFATPTYAGTLDAHEDIGFLCLLDDRVLFLSETRTLEVNKSDIECVKFRPNIHSILGLGRWISIEGTRAGVSIRMLVEPREKKTMLQNRKYSISLKATLNRWSGK